MTTDYLIVGTGVAGLSLAIQLAERLPQSTITVITKAEVKHSNTYLAQGGMAAVSDSNNDSFVSHIKDTVEAGDGLSNLQVVKMVVKQAPNRLRELVSWGVKFDLEGNASFHLAKEGGHSHNRIVHRGDFTGKEIIDALVRRIRKHNNIEVKKYCMAIDLIKHPSGQSCEGLSVLNVYKSTLESMYAKKIILATGGIGKVYQSSTNPSVATGDGIAMAYRIGATVSDMEFVQFHPTLLFNSVSQHKSFLISEAIRGFGAYIVNKKGQRFLLNADTRGELATRDIVAKAIWTELKTTNETHVLLDCRHLDQSELRQKFPRIVKQCTSLGLDLSRDLIPVVPSAHYVCGGINVDRNGRTDILNLYACGECANTGLHGANRLASNSLLEALVYAYNIAEDISQNAHHSMTNIMQNNTIELIAFNESWIVKLKKALQEVMYQKVFILKHTDELLSALDYIIQLKQTIRKKQQEGNMSASLVELKNLATIAYLVVKQSIERSKNVGSFHKVI